MVIVRPPGIYPGWQCISQGESLLVNCPDQPYNYKKPEEHRAAHDDPNIPYNWDIVFK